VSEKRVYTTIAISRKTYIRILSVRHKMEEREGKSMSFNDIVESLCKSWSESNAV